MAKFLMCIDSNYDETAEVPLNINAIYQVSEFETAKKIKRVQIITSRGDFYYINGTIKEFMHTIKNLPEI